ncbi:TetR/AcrR family transcriptional regulator [Luethyella okanaganae]|uniref:TetR family transcriptional regulator n=1 Tax=Luethyella okanaganae TaxID=69372 RepID=A0ABW1VC09_9MICO
MIESTPPSAQGRGPAEDRPRGRPRGRPRASADDTRALILDAAEREFADRGYEAASLRAIARRAGVDPALVHHYFNDKSDLFAEIVAVPIRPDKAVARILAGPRDEIGTSIVRFLLAEWESPAVQARGTAILRSAIASTPATRYLKEFLTREILRRIAEGIDAPDAELRANLAASQVVGLILTRYVMRLEPVASAPIEDLVARIGPVLQWHLVGFSGAARSPLDDENLQANNSSHDE